MEKNRSDTAGLERENGRLRRELQEARETIEAIRRGEVDALVVQGPRSNQVFTLHGADRPYRLFIEEMQQAAVTLSQRATILYHNRRFAELFGGSALGRDFHDFLAPESRPAFDSMMERAKTSRAAEELNFCSPQRTAIPGFVAISAFPSDETIAFCMVIADLTEQKQHEELVAAESALKAAKAEAERANRAKDEFLAVLSHELRTPLTSMMGWVRMLQTRQFDEETQRKALAVIERNVRVQAHLIEDLLDVSRLIAGKLSVEKKPVEFGMIVKNTTDGFEQAAKAKGVRLAFQCSGAFPLEGDETRLQQVAGNIISNAIKFTPVGGCVTVSLEEESGWACLRVADTGKGISPEFLPHIFNRFSQEDTSKSRRYMGLGLGLAICHHIVELHGGSIIAQSEGEGKGATFSVRLPLVSLPNVLPPAAASSDVAGDAPLRSKSVLIVEDDADVCDFISECLRLAGAAVSTAGNAQIALRVFEETRPAALVCDIGLPGDDGTALMRKIRALEKSRGWQPAFAVALTGYAQPEDVQNCHAAGFQAHLAKPIDPDTLVRKVAEAE